MDERVSSGKEQVKDLSDIAKREEEMLARWQSARIFEKSLEQTRDSTRIPLTTSFRFTMGHRLRRALHITGTF